MSLFQLLKKNKSIIELGQFVLKESLSFISEYNAVNNSDISVSVNVSLIELINSNYASYLQDTLAKSGVSPNKLTLEITESTMIDPSSYLTDQLYSLKNFGVNISLDDFGTGYASLNNLIFTPLSEVKIDRVIMKELMNNKMIYSFIRSFISLCHEHSVKNCR